MDIELDERLSSNATETVDLPGLDDQDVAGAGFELTTIDIPEAAARLNELHFIIRVAVGSGAAARLSIEQKSGETHSTIVGAYKVESATAMG